jgi:predicted P-loop ATPase
MTEYSPFDIRIHLTKLTLHKETSTEWRYICPVCEGNNLTVAKDTGAYQCWNGCDVAHIRNAIAPLNPPKLTRPQSSLTWQYTDSEGNPLIQTRRVDDGQGKRKIWQEYLIDGQWQAKATAATKAARESAKRAVMPLKWAAGKKAIANGEPIFWVEGESCVEALESIGLIATTSIGGSAGYRKYGDYSQVFRGAKLVICPDRDIAGMKYALEVAKDYPDAQWLYAFPDSPSWRVLSKDGGWDIADWIDELRYERLTNEQVRDRILAAVEPRRVSAKPASEADQSSDDKEEIPRPALARRYEAVKRIVGDRLKLNALTKELELNNQPLEIEELQLNLAVKNGVNLPDNQAGKILGAIGKENAYNPVVEYLQRVRNLHGDNTEHLDFLCKGYLSSGTPLHNTYLRKFLIAAVARAFQPGCKVDTALILQGKQGIGKSSFFKVLASEDWFDDSLGNVSDKDERLKLHKVWFCEWAELESIFKRRDISQVKAFLTSSRDLVRPPYGRSVVSFARTSVIVGSTNENEFLSDSTGNRRFWVIPVKTKINLKKLATERDQIWAAAVAAYEKSESWWLTDQEEEFSSALVSEFQIKDPWQAAIESYVATLPKVTTSEIINQCLKLPIERQTRGDEMRVANVLKQLGWVSKVARENKRQVRTWFREILPDPKAKVAAGCHTPEEPLQSKDYSHDNPCDNLGSEVVTPSEVVTASNPSGCDNLDPLLQPVTTSSSQVVTASNLGTATTSGGCDNLIQPQTPYSENQSNLEDLPREF